MGEELAAGFPVAHEAVITCPACQTPLRLAPGWKVALPSAPEINGLLALLGCPGEGCFVAVAGSTLFDVAWRHVLAHAQEAHMSKHSLTIGRIVHFVLPSGIPRPAIVVRVWDNDLVNLQVFTDGTNDSALGSGTPGANVVHQTSIPHEVPTAAKPLSPATWHWPDERAAALAEGAIAEGMRGT